MFSLVYKSVSNSIFKEDQILEMLEKSRKYNNSAGISGCLLYYDDQFLQYLEGNQLKVLSLYDKISQDKRHSKVQLLSFGEIAQREFKGWDMAYENFQGDNDHLSFLKLSLFEFLKHDNALQTKTNKPSFWKELSKFMKNKTMR